MTPSLSERTLRQIQTMARKLQDNPSYMAWIIVKFQKQEKLTTLNLVNLLGANEESLAKLALCKRPDSNSSEFSNQIRQISEHTTIDPHILARLIRQFESVTALAGKRSANPELKASASQLGLAVARDRTTEDDTEEHSEDEGDVAEQ
jgi:hypothetical protein